jgi:hypothetical protein
MLGTDTATATIVRLDLGPEGKTIEPNETVDATVASIAAN